MEFQELWVDRNAQAASLTQRIMKRFPKDSIHIVSNRDEALGRVDSKEDNGGAPKIRRLLITIEKGRFLRRCPGTPGMACCNLFVLSPIVGCPYDCTYCFLQAYQNDPFTTLYANLEDMEHEVKGLVTLNQGKILRVCSGELADSLALEPVDEGQIIAVLSAEMDLVRQGWALPPDAETLEKKYGAALSPYLRESTAHTGELFALVDIEALCTKYGAALFPYLDEYTTDPNSHIRSKAYTLILSIGSKVNGIPNGFFKS